jgi:glucosamine-6-phosphate deaminase
MIEAGFVIRSYSSRMAMEANAAQDIAQHLLRKLDCQDEVSMIFAAAPSQLGTLTALRASRSIDWSRVTAFHMDEYVGLPDGHPALFGSWLQVNLFDHLPFKHVHLIGTDGDPDAATAKYSECLASSPIDIVCLGIGVNGHIAFNDPPVADFDDPKSVKLVELDAVCRQQQVDDGCFSRITDVPRKAITLTIPRLLDADRLFCMVPGAAKRHAVTRTLYGPIEAACPASILRTHANCTLYLDEESTPQ